MSSIDNLCISCENQIKCAEKMFIDGVAVIDLTGFSTITHEMIAAEILSGPTVEPGVKCISELQGGSFKALCTPTSFHGVNVRELRQDIWDAITTFLRTVSQESGLKNSECLFDRYRHQLAGQKVGGEKYHRDESTGALLTDIILGGWINTGDCDQYFTFLPGTQLAENKKGGHGKTTPTADQLARLRTATVKPNQLILFYQNIIHKVHGSKLKADPSRLHFGVRFTNADKPLFPLDDVFDKFDIPLLPSGQKPRIWPKLYWTNWPEKLAQVTKCYKPEFHVKRKVKSTGEIRTIVPEQILPTDAMRDEFWPYDEDERAIYLPSKKRKRI